MASDPVSTILGVIIIAIASFGAFVALSCVLTLSLQLWATERDRRAESQDGGRDARRPGRTHRRATPRRAVPGSESDRAA